MKIKSIISTLSLILVLSLASSAHGDEGKKYSKLRNAVVEKVQQIRTDISGYTAVKVYIHFTVDEDGRLIIQEVQSRNKKVSKAIIKGLNKLKLDEKIETDQNDFWLTIDYKVM